ncbi:MAG: uroporphyrinogen-III synthase [Bacteroidia bacterium]
MAYRVLATKKLQPNQKLYLLNAGLSVIEADFIGIRYKPFEINNTTDNLIFTSQNGFVGFLKHKASGVFAGSKVFCVGEKTKNLIERHGFTVVEVAHDAESLAAILVEKYKEEHFMFFSGSMRRDTLPDALAKSGVHFTETEVYDTVLTPHKIGTKCNGILFFSPSGVESYLKENKITTEICFCIGQTTANALNGITNNVIIANAPSIENVIVQVRNYFKDTDKN